MDDVDPITYVIGSAIGEDLDCCGRKSFMPVLGDQSYHFNTIEGASSHTGVDSRMFNAYIHLRNALTAKKRGEIKTALEELGTGLHPLQDSYAHTDDVVFDGLYKDHFNEERGIGHNVDRPEYRPKQYHLTEEATKEYLKIFQEEKLPSYDEFFDRVGFKELRQPPE